MRLTSEQQQAIKSAFEKVFGHGEVVLFGSRVDDEQKGGDIDLFLRISEQNNNLFNKKIDFLVALKQQIGDQKIDVVLEPYASSEIKHEVQQKGILLWRI